MKICTSLATEKFIAPNKLHTNFIVSPVRAHQVGFSITKSSDDIQLYLKPKDVVRLMWLPREVLPGYIIKNPNDIKINIQLFQQRDRPSTSSESRWESIDGTYLSNLDNTGSVDFTVPEDLKMSECFNQDQLCPVAFNLTVTEGTMVNITGSGEVLLPSGQSTPAVGIWSSVAYLETNFTTESSLSLECDSWFSPPPPESERNKIPEARLGRYQHVHHHKL